MLSAVQVGRRDLFLRDLTEAHRVGLLGVGRQRLAQQLVEQRREHLPGEFVRDGVLVAATLAEDVRETPAVRRVAW
mgnify:CR=1 FL=1